MLQPLKVPDSVLKSADKCRYSHACLTDAGFETCKLEPAARGTVLFVKSEPKQHCPYKTDFGSAIVCTCPVRQAIYEQTGA